MVLKKFFKGKRKMGLPDTSSRSLPTEPSGILAREFPPLSSRAKSPSDVLDFIGHPRCSILDVADDDDPTSPPPSAYVHPHQQRIPPIQTPHRALYHSYSYDDDQQRKRAAATPPALVMPQPIMAVPPTRDTVLRSTGKDKTLVSVQGAEAAVDKEEQQEQQQEEQDVSPSTRTSCTTLQGLYEQLESYRLEHQEWLRREREHQQNEEWMIMKLYDVQTQLDQLTAHVDGRHQSIFDCDDYGDYESSGYASEEGEDDEEEECFEDQEDSTSGRRRFYYHPMHHSRPPVPYRHNPNQQQHHLPWLGSMMPTAFYQYPHHRSHPHSLPQPSLPLQVVPYPRYMYADSRPPVRRQKSSDGSLPSARKTNSVRRSYSTNLFHS